jgi:hypothetical protein
LLKPFLLQNSGYLLHAIAHAVKVLVGLRPLLANLVETIRNVFQDSLNAVEFFAGKIQHLFHEVSGVCWKLCCK